MARMRRTRRWLIPSLLAAGATLGLRRLGRRGRLALRGQVAIVTGGSRGLGLLVARRLARAGCRLVVCARDERELAEAERDLRARGAEVLAVRCDVGVAGEVEQMVADAVRRFGCVDVLVNCAGVLDVGPVDSMTLADFEAALAVNFWGIVHASLAVLPLLRAQGAGRILNITSIGGKVAVPHLLAYGAAKFAAVGFSEGLAAEVAKDGVAVTTVVPGLMRTGSPVNAAYHGAQAREYLWFALGDLTPLTSMSAERAARRIVRALERGEIEVTLGWQAKLLRLAHALFPSVVIRAFGLANRLLPQAADVSSRLGSELTLPAPLQRLLEPTAEDAHQYVSRR